MKNSILKFTTFTFLGLALVGCQSTEQTTKTVPETTVVKKQYNTEPLPKALSAKLEQSMVKVKGGKFLMGSESPEARTREKPVHEVELDTFYISKFEVTQDLFMEVMGWNPSYFRCDNCPLNNLSEKQVKIFLAKLNARTGKEYRLPTEAEWEFAARGGNESKNYKYSGSDDINEVAWWAGNAMHQAKEVGLKKPNELGLYDMTGNMWELCADDFDEKSYAWHEKKNPRVEINIKQAKIKMKVTRGSGYEFDEIESLVFKRDMVSDNVRMPDVGLRLAHSK